MKLSIVATLYQSEKYIHEFCERAAFAAEKLVGNNYEIVFVNDGSPDNSLQIAIEAISKNPAIRVVDLSRNFGHHKAMMTGLAQAQGETIFLIDSDLEEEPEWLLSFASQMEEECCDVVYGIQIKRKGSFFERYTGEIFYRLLRFLTKENLPANITTARLMTRRYVNALLLYQEQEIYISGLWHITGFAQHSQPVKKHCSSDSTYTLKRKFALFVNSITSFSNLPLVGIFYVGLLIMVFASAYTLALIIQKFYLHTLIEGWTSVMASIWLLSGLIISFIGIVGIYLSKIFIEIKQRPYTIIRHIYQKDSLSPLIYQFKHQYDEKLTIEND